LKTEDRCRERSRGRFLIGVHEKGEPVARRGRKARGLEARQPGRRKETPVHRDWIASRVPRLALGFMLAAGIALGGISPGAADTAPTCQGRVATIVGTPGSDRLNGTPGQDVILGLGGADVIHARKGIDIACGGSGSDRVAGNAGADVLFGNGGDDTIKGGGNVDVENGGTGDDTVEGGAGNDILEGNLGEDNLLGNAGNDLLDGILEADVCVSSHSCGDDAA
jgi:Ca2+-binding RTX toxin-like protein